MNKNEKAPATPGEILAANLGEALKKLAENYTKEGDTAQTIKLREEVNNATQAAQEFLHQNSKS
jgi:hypothetical protein